MDKPTKPWCEIRKRLGRKQTDMRGFKIPHISLSVYSKVFTRGKAGCIISTKPFYGIG